VGNLTSKLRRFEKEMVVQGKIGDQPYRQVHMRPEKVFSLRQVLSSYLGHFNHADSYRLTRKLFTTFPFLGDIFKLVRGNTLLLPRYESGEPSPNLAGQYNWFCQTHPLAVVMIQVGRFCEIYEPSAQKAAAILKLRISKSCRGLGLQAGLPMGGLCTAKKRLKAARCGYIVVAENGWLPSGLKKRVVTEKLTVEQLMAT